MLHRDEKDKRQFGEIERMLTNLGEKYGAEEDEFRNEGTAVALPPNYYRFYDSDGSTDYGLRLYCIWVNEEIVILLNGDRKTVQNPRHCPNVSTYHEMANKIGDAFFDSLNIHNEIEIDGMDLLFEDDFLLKF
jgi:hypothetical protein